MASRNSRFGEIANALSQTRLSSDEAVGIVGYAIGALYGLRQADTLGYSDRINSTSRNLRAAELVGVTCDLRGSSEVSSAQWLAGWFFNSALHHIDAATDRFDAFLKVQRPNQRDAPIGSVARDIGHLKHRPVGLGEGRNVDLDSSISELADLAGRMLTHFGNAA
jgi:hypothetical protein